MQNIFNTISLRDIREQGVREEPYNYGTSV